MSGASRTPHEEGPRRERLRLDATASEKEANGSITTRVTLEWRERKVEGRAEGLDTRENVIRLGAQAAVRAVADITLEEVDIELLGVKATRAFGTWVAMAYLRIATPEDTHNLLGARALADDDLVRGGAIAVLDALNRILRPELIRD